MPFAKPVPDDGRITATLQKMAERWAPRSVLDVELLTVREVAGLLHKSVRWTYAFIHSLPEGAIVKVGGQGSDVPRNVKILVHSWALGQALNLSSCPGCGREWPPRS